MPSRSKAEKLSLKYSTGCCLGLSCSPAHFPSDSSTFHSTVCSLVLIPHFFILRVTLLLGLLLALVGRDNSLHGLLPIWTALCQVCLCTSPRSPCQQVLHYPAPQLPSCQGVRHLLPVYLYKVLFFCWVATQLLHHFGNCKPEIQNSTLTK